MLIELLARQPRVNAGVGDKRLEFLLKHGKVVWGRTLDYYTQGDLERSLVEWPDEPGWPVVSIPPE